MAHLIHQALGAYTFSMEIENIDPYDFSIKETGGVKIYYKNIPWAPCTHINFSFQVGTFNDPNKKEGLAHFLEHLIGNGCPSLPDKKAIKEFNRIYMLNSRNAFTSYHYTTYVGKCLPEHFSRVFAAMKDYVFNPFLRPEDTEHERKVITQEAWGRYKNEKLLNYIKKLSNNIYHGHERSRVVSPLGLPETVAEIERGDIDTFHKTHYVKENLSIILVGAIQDKNFAEISDVVRDIPSGKPSNITSGKIGKPKNSRVEVRSDDIGDPQEQAEFSILRATDRIDGEEKELGSQTRMLLYDLLFERLRLEHSLCYGVSVFWGRYRNYLDIGISVKTAEDKLPTVEKEAWSVIKEVIDGKWSDRFITVHKMAMDQIRSNERLSNTIIMDATDDLSVGNRIVSLEEILEDAGKVTYEKVQKLMKKVFDSDYIVTEIILPAKKS
mgnify:FL=1